MQMLMILVSKHDLKYLLKLVQRWVVMILAHAVVVKSTSNVTVSSVNHLKI
jgi:hypothetical protein